MSNVNFVKLFFAPDDVDPEVPEADVVPGGGDQPQPGGEAGQVLLEERGETEARVSSVLLSLAESIHQEQAEARLRDRGQRLENTAEQRLVRVEPAHFQTESAIQVDSK